MRAQNRDLSVSPDGKAPEYVPTPGAGTFPGRQRAAVTGPRHIRRTCSLPRIRHERCRNSPLPIAYLRWGEVGVRGSRELRLHANSVSRSKRARMRAQNRDLSASPDGKAPRIRTDPAAGTFPGRQRAAVTGPRHIRRIAACRAFDTSAPESPSPHRLLAMGRGAG